MSLETQNETIDILNQIRDKITPAEIHEIPKFSQTKLHRISSANTKLNDVPNYVIKNKLAKDVKLDTISIIPDSEFQTKGMIKILLDDFILFENDAVGDFTDVAEFTKYYEGGILFPRNTALKFYIYNGTDGNSIAATVSASYNS